jgi:hypothetical protein
MSVYFHGYTEFGEIAGNVEIDAVETAKIGTLLDVLGIFEGYVEFAGQVLVNRDKSGETQQYRFIDTETPVSRDKTGRTTTYDDKGDKIVIDPQIIRGTVVYRDNDGQMRVITA